MKRQDIEQTLKAASIDLKGWRYVGPSFIELTIKIKPAMDLLATIQLLRRLDVYEIRIDTEHEDEITCQVFRFDEF